MASANQREQTDKPFSEDVKGVEPKITEKMRADAKANPNSWLYVIDKSFDPNGPVPSWAVVGAYPIDRDGNIAEDFYPNDRYRASFDAPADRRKELRGDELRRLEMDFGRLIRNEGLSPRRIELDTPELLELLGTNDAQKVYRNILSTLDQMEDDQYTDVLRNAFGVGYSKKPSLFARRLDWASHRNNSVSQDTVRRWEKRAIQALARKFVWMPPDTAGQMGSATSANDSDEVDEVERLRNIDPAILAREITDLKRQVAEQNVLLHEIMKRLPDNK